MGPRRYPHFVVDPGAHEVGPVLVRIAHPALIDERATDLGRVETRIDTLP